MERPQEPLFAEATDCQWQLTLRPEMGELQQVKYWRSEGTIE